MLQGELFFPVSKNTKQTKLSFILFKSVIDPAAYLYGGTTMPSGMFNSD